MDFIHPENLCGQTLLHLVSRGNSILAELQRLVDHVPQVFYGGDTTTDPMQQRFSNVLFDFSYLKAPERYERKLANDPSLAAADDEFGENYGEVIVRFYGLFENIVKFIGDFNHFLEQLQDGFFLQHSVEDVVLDTHGKQLMAEALFLFGTMLLVLERRVPGPVRERIVVAYLRLRGESMADNLEEVTDLCKCTGAEGGKKPANYPESYFARFKVPSTMVHMVIDRLRSDDVYNLTQTYPSPEHRTAALSQQASVLVVLLFFAPDVLQRERATMREVVDKHFSDNWVCTIYMGWVVHLDQLWAPYRAAREALNNTLELEHVADLVRRYSRRLQESEQLLDKYLTEGVLTEQYVLEHVPPLLHALRKCNTTVRWLLLHRLTRHRKLAQLVAQGPPAGRIVRALVRTAQLEFQIKSHMERLLETRQQKWEAAQGETSQMMGELADFFGGGRALTRVEKDEDLQAWFSSLSKQVESLDFRHSTQSKTGRKIQKLIEALNEVEQFDVIDTSLQIKEFLAVARGHLTDMVRVSNVREDVMSQLETISDLSYAWELLREHVPMLHSMVREDPATVVHMRAMCLKLASFLDVPLTRINQAGSKDVVSVAEYYSGELVSFLRRILAVVPETVFHLLNSVIAALNERMKPLPAKMEQPHLKQYAQLEERYELARATHEISVHTEGVLAMKRTLLGVVEVDPRQVLEDGIRRELAQRVAAAMHKMLVFQPARKKDRVTPQLVEGRLEDLMGKLEGFSRSFEYIQDYIGIYGLKMWHEELSRVIAYNVEAECNRYVRHKVMDRHSRYQSKAMPIPRFAPLDRKNVTFMGRLLDALLVLTDPRAVSYSPECFGWLDSSGAEIVGMRLMHTLKRSVSVLGVSGVDRLLSFRIVRDLKRVTAVYKAQPEEVATMLSGLQEAMLPLRGVPGRGPRVYITAVKKLPRGLFDHLLALLLRVGQAQLLRRHLASVRAFGARLDSALLTAALETANRAVLHDVRAHYRDPSQPYPPDKNPLLVELAQYLERTGLHDPLTSIYVTSEPLPYLPSVLFLFLISQLHRLAYDPTLGTLVARKPADPIDGAPLAVGMATLLRQFHPSYMRLFLAYCAQFIRSNVFATYKDSEKSKQALPGEVNNMIAFLELFCSTLDLPRSALHEWLPSFLVDGIVTA